MLKDKCAMRQEIGDLKAELAEAKDNQSNIEGQLRQCRDRIELLLRALGVDPYADHVFRDQFFTHISADLNRANVEQFQKQLLANMKVADIVEVFGRWPDIKAVGEDESDAEDGR